MQRSSALLAARVAATSSLLRAPTKTPTAFAETVAQYDAAGVDVAGTSTKEFLKLQSLLIPYRIVRLNEEFKAARELGFGALPSGKDIPSRLALLFIFYFVGFVFGRRSLFRSELPPLSEEQIAEKKKANEQTQSRLAAAFATSEEKRLARVEKEKAAEEKNRASVEAAYQAAEERRAARALAKERGY